MILVLRVMVCSAVYIITTVVCHTSLLKHQSKYYWYASNIFLGGIIILSSNFLCIKFFTQHLNLKGW